MNFVGVCRDGPWQGQFLTGAARFAPVDAPWGGPLGEYCNDGNGHWNWRAFQ